MSESEPLTERILRAALHGPLRSRIASSEFRRWSHQNRAYKRWVKAEARSQSFPALDADPLISIVVPAFNPPLLCVAQLLESVVAQTYDRWELCVADASTDRSAQKSLAAAADRDGRIRYRNVGANLGIAGNTNIAIDMAGGDFVAFLDHDDTLSTTALEEVVRVLRAAPDTDLFYSDEDKLTANGKHRLEPFFKPDWSPDLFLAGNYLAHFVVVRRSITADLGGIRTGFDGAQDYDFVLRVLDRTQRVHHVPSVSYHWRMVAGSTAKTIRNKSGSPAAGRRALEEYTVRNAISADVTDIDGHPTHYRLSYQLPPRLTVKVVSRDGPIPGWVNTAAAYAGLSPSDQVSDLTLFIDPDLEPLTSDWLRELAGVAAQPGRGLVGGVITDSKGRIAEAGYFADGGALRPAFVGRLLDRPTLAGPGWWPRDLLVPALSCCIGLTERIGSAPYSDAGALAVQLHRNGLRNVMWPFARLRARRPVDHPGIELVDQDPYLNPHISLQSGRLRLKSVDRRG